MSDSFQLPHRLEAPKRLLLGPGPSPVNAQVLQALAQPTLGHLDPVFLRVMDECRDMLRHVFGTANQLTIPMSGTGSAGMETLMVNLVEPGDRALVVVNGVFGGRIAESARRAGATVQEVPVVWGEVISAERLREEVERFGGTVDVIALVHAETSTGALQPLEGLRAVADEAGALLVLDTVTSLGGTPVNLDDWGIDAAYSGSQKCLSCPPGLAPVSLSSRALSKLNQRKTPVQSWYLDLSLIAQYWGAERAYHHTAPTNMVVALHEALRLCCEEGLSARFARHRRAGAALQAGLEAMGLVLPVDARIRLPQLTVVAVPEGVAAAAVQRRMLSEHGIEIGGGLGNLKGRAWRIGMMGSGATLANITRCLAGLGEALQGVGFSHVGDAEATAKEVWSAQADVS